MALSDEMRRLTQHLLNAHDARIEAVADGRSATAQELAGFHVAHQNMAAEQRERLDEGRARLTSNTASFLAEAEASHQAMAAEQRERLGGGRGRLASDTASFLAEAEANHQAMATEQQERLDEGRARLASDTASFLTEAGANHQAMAAEQRERFDEGRSHLAADVTAMRARLQTEQRELRADQADARRVWSSFTTLVRRRPVERPEPSVKVVTVMGKKAPSPVEGAAPAEEAIEQPSPEVAKAVPSDDFTVIRGIGAGMQQHLNEGGIYTFAELAERTPDELRQILGDVGRLAKVEEWIGEAWALAGLE